VTGYLVQRAADERFQVDAETFEVDGDALSYTDATASGGGTYYYRVCTRSAAGWSPWSAAAQVAVP
jgi:hypothetical protein